MWVSSKRTGCADCCSNTNALRGHSSMPSIQMVGHGLESGGLLQSEMILFFVLHQKTNALPVGLLTALAVLAVALETEQAR